MGSRPPFCCGLSAAGADSPSRHETFSGKKSQKENALSCTGPVRVIARFGCRLIFSRAVRFGNGFCFTVESAAKSGKSDLTVYINSDLRKERAPSLGGGGSAGSNNLWMT